jgi:hypothetical protein
MDSWLSRALLFARPLRGALSCVPLADRRWRQAWHRQAVAEGSLTGTLGEATGAAVEECIMRMTELFITGALQLTLGVPSLVSLVFLRLQAQTQRRVARLASSPAVSPGYHLGSKTVRLRVPSRKLFVYCVKGVSGCG